MSEEPRTREGWRPALAGELRERLDAWSDRTGIAVETWALPGEEASAEVAGAVLAVLEEALANIERHSRARVVSVAVTLGRGGLRMTVSDDGAGFAGQAAGRGVDAMRGRFEALGGTLSVHGVKGEGTTVTGTLPRR
ncbi:sensor histidine kinase [Streptosporangium sandarakinum]|uniref:sensor histidine kinase n=1 Tax=Streptosporangium sandarakinum TaxID=1260955 RepID=UPI0037BC2607